jgi:hypothetical protein
LIWPKSFEQRLLAWNQLRESSAQLPVDQALFAINHWWQNSPWCAYYLHWDDLRDWPNPWQLLNDNIYCDIARGLGIMYTITMLDRDDLQDARLVETQTHNLVLVQEEKYILNWDSSTILNTNFKSVATRKSVTQQSIRQKLQ